MKNNSHLHLLDLILEELYLRLDNSSVDTYYKPTIEYCKELIKKEKQQ